MIAPEKIAPFYKTIDYIRKAAIVVLFAFIVVSMGFQIVLRNLDWTNEILRYVNIWVIFLGASLAVKHSEHLQMSLLCEKLFGQAKQKFVQNVRLVIVILFLIVIIAAGIMKTISTAALQAQAFPISLSWFYIAIPVGSALMVMDYLLILLYGSHPFVNHSQTKEEPPC